MDKGSDRKTPENVADSLPAAGQASTWMKDMCWRLAG
jgi:hypothetical protein